MSPSFVRIIVLAVSLATVTTALAQTPRIDADDFAQLFNGRVVESNARTRQVKLRYDFTVPSQLDDFAGLLPGKSPKLHPAGMATPSWLRARFDGDVELRAKFSSGGGPCAVLVSVDPVTLEGYVFLFGANDRPRRRAFTAVAKFRQGSEPKIIYRGIVGAWKSGIYTIDVLRKNDVLQLRLDGRVVIKTRDATHRSGKVGFAGDLVVEALEVSGKLERRWCEKALATPNGAAESDDLFKRIGASARLRLRRDLPEWKTSFDEETEHYLVSSDVSAAFSRHFARCAEAMHGLLSSALRPPKGASGKARVILFGTQREFQDFGAPKHSIGFYHAKNGNLYLFDHVDPEVTRRALLHEGVRQYLDRLLDDAPPWLVEGMVRYFETARLARTSSGLRFELGAKGSCYPPLRTTVQLGKDVLVRDLVRMDKKAYGRLFHRGRHDQHAWGLCHFLIEADKGKYRCYLQAYVGALAAGKARKDAFETAFGRVDWQVLQERWRKHVLGL